MANNDFTCNSGEDWDRFALNLPKCLVAMQITGIP